MFRLLGCPVSFSYILGSQSPLFLGDSLLLLPLDFGWRRGSAGFLTPPEELAAFTPPFYFTDDVRVLLR